MQANPLLLSHHFFFYSVESSHFLSLMTLSHHLSEFMYFWIIKYAFDTKYMVL